jgi:hypothetical protein
VPDNHDQLIAAQEYAQLAATVAGKLKPGTYDAVQALALTSIAHSLTVIAGNSQSR